MKNQDKKSSRSIKLDDFSLIIPAPFGSIGVVSDGKVVSEISFLQGNKIAKDTSNAFIEDVGKQISSYLIDSSFILDFPVLQIGTLFQQNVWKELRNIPAGETYTYSELSRLLHSSPRAVGRACATNSLVLYYPCHRVVAVNGIGGFSGETDPNSVFLNIKRWLLKHENALKD